MTISIYFSITIHKSSLHIHPISKALITTILEIRSNICSTGNGVSTAYVLKRKRRISIKNLVILFFVSRLAVKSIRPFEVIIFSVNLTRRENEH